MTALQYLIFEHSEDTDGHAVFDAMASTSAQQAAAVQAEVARVLNWAQAAFPDAHGPLADGFEWDHDLQQGLERQGDLTWHTTSLTISASPAFAEAFLARFPPDDQDG
ncbi:MAG: hypothetical protein EOP40_09290 [Rubrivivax sp.]|nr:MAG: hypothetical protein EOP40_09290 [Rubrivivax sp.]